MNQKLIVFFVLPLFVSGCATIGGMDDKSSSVAFYSSMGCTAGEVLANAIGINAASGCSAGTLVGGFVTYEKARHDELAKAEEAQRDAVAYLQGAKVGKVVTDNVAVKEKATGQVKQVRAFREASIDLPLNKRGTPEYNSAMDKFKIYAEKIADERGKSEIVVSYAPSDAKAQKISTEIEEFETASGKGTVQFFRAVNKNLKTGVVRVTVRTTNADRVEV